MLIKYHGRYIFLKTQQAENTDLQKYSLKPVNMDNNVKKIGIKID